MPDSIVIAGSLSQRPGVAGHTWVFLQYLLGFKRLGWRVLFVDRLDPGMCLDAEGRPCSFERSENVRYTHDVMRSFGLAEDFALIDGGSGEVLGMTRAEALSRTRDAAFLFNVMGYLRDDDFLGAARRRVFLDIDPGFGQMWCALGLHDLFAGHEAFVTIGLNIGRPDCSIPTCGLDWITTTPPVVLEQWPRAAGLGESFTTVASWRGGYGPVEYRGTTYGLRVHEFRRFAHLPRLTGERFRLALNIHPAEENDLDLLGRNGWILCDPKIVAGDPHAYRAFIAASRTEFVVAKGIYVQTGSGWLSDRSLCYLASGRPVLAQETGFSHHVPSAVGLVAFTTPDEAAAGVEAIRSQPALHTKAARDLAEAYFDSDKVLPRIVERLPCK